MSRVGRLIMGQHSRNRGTCCILAASVAAVLVAALAAGGAYAEATSNEDVHVVFLTDCTSYSDWQTLGSVYSWRESGQVRTFISSSWVLTPLGRIICTATPVNLL